METSLFKLALTSQTIFGAIQFVVVFFILGGVLGFLISYDSNPRLTFSCSVKPDDFTKQLCYDKYTSTMSPWLIPRNVVAIIFGVLCVCWICFLFCSAVKIRQIKRDPEEAWPNQRQTQWGKLSCMYNIHVVFRLVFLGGIIGVFCSSQTIYLPSMFECTPRTPQTNKTVISVNQTESKMQCNDLHYKEKSNLNIVILVIGALVMMLGISELLQLTLTRKPFQEMLLGNVLEVTDNLDLENMLATENNSSGETKNGCYWNEEREMKNGEWGNGRKKWSAFIWSGCNNDFSVTDACRRQLRSVSSASSFSFFAFKSRKEHNGKGYCS